MIVDLLDIIEGLERTTNEEEFYYNPENGEIISQIDLPNYDGDEECIPLPTKREIDDYGIMQSFVAEQPEGKAKEWLSNAIHGRGAFRMFRATAERFGLIQDWYQYRDRMYRATAIEWCEYYGIEYTSSLTDIYDDDEETDEEEYIPPVKTERTPLRIVNITKDNISSIVYMADACRCERNKLTDNETVSDLEEAENDLRRILKEGSMIMAVSDQGRFIGYAVLCDNELCEIYVRPENRKQGVGKMLMKEAEKAAGVLEMRVEPNNDGMLYFLQKQGYNLLTELTVTKGNGEKEQCYSFGEHSFKGGK